MSRTDLIADSFTMMRNAMTARKDEVVIPYSRILENICGIFKKEGYIENFKDIEVGGFKKIKIYLRYEGKKSIVRSIQRVSKPGKRVYVARHEVPSVLRGYGVAIISTSSGILTDKEAREKGLGGEVLGKIW